MKKLILISALALSAQSLFAQIEASNLPTATLTGSDYLLATHGGPVVQSSVGGFGTVIAPYILYSTLGGTLPATVTITNSPNIAFIVVATNGAGTTQTNYVMTAVVTNLTTVTITNVWQTGKTNYLYFTNGLLSAVVNAP